MHIHTNKKELQELAKYFYNITNTLISIYDEKENLICTYPDSLCRFCTEVRKDPVLKRKCLKNDAEAFRVCKESRKTHTYHCHMGLVEVATPIIYNNIILGYMLFGQITDSEDKVALLSRVTKAAEQYSVSLDVLRQGLEDIRCHSDEYIQSISRILEMCANYIWLNSIISIKKESLALSLELYIKDHVQEDLSVARLCREFNIGRSRLYEVAVDNFGCSITAYIQQYRNAYAKKLLQEESMTVSEVAEAVGISDVNYFIRFFKKQNQCTPKAFQKMGSL